MVYARQNIKLNTISSNLKDIDLGSPSSNHERGGYEETLNQLIATAPIEDLRKALIGVTRLHEDQIRAVNIFADLRQKQAKATKPSRKRKSTRNCAGCSRDFDEADNVEGSCTYYHRHPGKRDLKRVFAMLEHPLIV